MSHQNGSFLFFFQNLSNVVAYTQSGLIVQCRKWFIKKQDIWFQDKGAHQGSPLPHTTGEFRWSGIFELF